MQIVVLNHGPLSVYWVFLLFARPQVRVVCQNKEVEMLQPWKVTPLYLGSVVNCYVRQSIHLNPLRPSPPFSTLRLISVWGGGCLYLPMATLLSTSVVHPHRIILPPERHLSPSQHPKTHLNWVSSKSSSNLWLLLFSMIKNKSTCWNNERRKKGVIKPFNYSSIAKWYIAVLSQLLNFNVYHFKI